MSTFAFEKKSFYALSAKKNHHSVKSLRPRVQEEKESWDNKLRKLDHAEIFYKENPITKPYRAKLADPCANYKVFHRQQDAFEYKKISQDLKVFAFESELFTDSSGKRMYLVCSYPHFYHYYSRQSGRHHYELILENTPCKLYFDLEFKREYNPELNGIKLLNTLIKFVCHHLLLIYGIHCLRKDILDLDASTEKKFSRHLIFQIGDLIYSDNINAGNFVHYIFSLLYEALGFSLNDDEKINLNISSPVKNEGKYLEQNHINQQSQAFGIKLTDLKQLLVKERDGKTTTFCDLGVYTKNRNFRLLHSSKLRQNNPLKIAKENEYVPKVPPHSSLEEVIFMDSLVTYNSKNNTSKFLTCDGFGRIKFRNQVKRNYDALNSSSSQPVDGFKESPFPEIDDYLKNNVICGNGIQGQIRKWSFFQAAQLLVFEIAKYRWCGNIGRHHKSNNIMILVDISKSIYYQKCHDPDCQMINYKSEDKDLPEGILKNYILDYDEDFDKASLGHEEEDDAELIGILDHLENDISEQMRSLPAEQDSDDWIDDATLLNYVEETEKNTPTENS